MLAVKRGFKVPEHEAGILPNHGSHWLTDPDAVVEAFDTDTAWREEGGVRGCSFGLLLGVPSAALGGAALVCLDCDGGVESYRALLDDAGAEARQVAESTLRVERGDPTRFHAYFVMPADEAPPSNSKLAPGLEWRAWGDFNCAPGALHPSHHYYAVTGGPTMTTRGEQPDGPWLFQSFDTDEAGDLVARWVRPLPMPAGLLDAIVARSNAPAGEAEAPHHGQPPALRAALERFHRGEPLLVAPVEPATRTVSAAPAPVGGDGYGRKAMAGELATLRAAVPGTRNETLNAAAFALYQLVDAGHLREDDVTDALLDAARLVGLTDTETHGTLRSARTAARRKPRLPQELTTRKAATMAGNEPAEPDKTGPDEKPGEESEPDKTTPRRSSWLPAPAGEDEAVIRQVYAGDVPREMPTVGPVWGGGGAHPGALFYRAKVNGLAGESGAGKSWVAMLAAHFELKAGQSVLYLDFEDDRAAVIGRFRTLGTPVEDVVRGLIYVHPDEPLKPPDRAALALLMAEREPSLVVVDSSGEALALFGKNPNADEDVAEFMRTVPRWLARMPCRPAVVLLDHQTKADDSGGLWPIGSQRKRAAISGAQYVLRGVDAFDRDTSGHSTIVCAKDRPGNFLKDSKVAQLVVTAHAGVDGESAFTLAAVVETAEDRKKAKRAKSDRLTDAVVRAVADLGGAASQNKIAEHLKGTENGLGVSKLRWVLAAAVDAGLLVGPPEDDETGGRTRAKVYRLPADDDDNDDDDMEGTKE